MTIFLVTVIKRYIGESCDTKPTTDTPPGSTFFETDTKMSLTYTGIAWTYDVLNPVYGIHAAQSIKITEEETDYETAYIVGTAAESYKIREAATALFGVPLAGPANSMKVTEGISVRLQDAIRSTSNLKFVELVSIAAT